MAAARAQEVRARAAAGGAGTAKHLEVGGAMLMVVAEAAMAASATAAETVQEV
jgi:hypothetical protein